MREDQARVGEHGRILVSSGLRSLVKVHASGFGSANLRANLQYPIERGFASLVSMVTARAASNSTAWLSHVASTIPRDPSRTARGECWSLSAMTGDLATPLDQAACEGPSGDAWSCSMKGNSLLLLFFPDHQMQRSFARNVESRNGFRDRQRPFPSITRFACDRISTKHLPAVQQQGTARLPILEHG
jgi:hypothetical protein